MVAAVGWRMTTTQPHPGMLVAAVWGCGSGRRCKVCGASPAGCTRVCMGGGAAALPLLPVGSSWGSSCSPSSCSNGGSGGDTQPARRCWAGASGSYVVQLKSVTRTHVRRLLHNTAYDRETGAGASRGGADGPVLYGWLLECSWPSSHVPAVVCAGGGVFRWLA
jgi:hypothetical protein